MYAAASMHWTEAEGRWDRVAALLLPGGTFACFGGQRDLTDPALAAAVEQARRPFLESDEVPSPDGTPVTAASRWPATELRACEHLTDVRTVSVQRRETVSADHFVGHLSTASAYLQLAARARQEVLARIRAALPARVELTSDVVLHLARRSPSRAA